MKILKLIFLLSISIGTLSMTKTDCKKYFSGKWKYSDLPVEQMYVIRTMDKQLEYTENGKYYYEFDIKWLSECKYQLTYKGTNSPIPAVSKIGEISVVEILNINKNKMKYKASFRDMEEVGDMIKIK